MYKVGDEEVTNTRWVAVRWGPTTPKTAHRCGLEKIFLPTRVLHGELILPHNLCYNGVVGEVFSLIRCRSVTDS